MDETGFKKILDKALEPIQKDLNAVKKDMSTVKKDINTLKGSVVSIEQTMTSYADSYKINQKNIERLDTRLDTVEDELGIEPPEALKVPHFSSK